MRWPVKAKGRNKRVPGGMNKTEESYARHLSACQIGGFIAWYSFETLKFKLAPNTFYTPDFVVMLNDGTIEIHEVKGHWEDDARVKIKVAAEKFPFTFKAFKALPKKQGGGFTEEVIGE